METPTHNQSALLPCPICGKNARLLHLTECFTARCRHTGTGGQITLEVRALDLDTARDLWNRRAAAPAVSSAAAASSTAALERALATLADEAARVNDTQDGSDEPLRYPALSHATELARVALARFQERP